MSIRVWWNAKRSAAWLIQEAPGKRRKTEVYPQRKWGSQEAALAAAEEAASALREELELRRQRVLRGPEGPIPAEHALRAWHAGAKARVSPEHWDNTGSLIATQLAPYFEAHPLDLRKITAYDVQNLAGHLARTRTRTGSTLALDTIKGCLRVLSATSRWLASQGELRFTPLPGITTIGVRVAEKIAPQGQREAWTHEEAFDLLEVARGTALETLLRAAIGTGARKAELLGLDWRYVNLRGSARGTVKPHFRVEQVLTKRNRIKPAPKTPGSRRPVELTPALVEMFHEMQRERTRQCGLRGDDPGLVFRSSTGEPWSYSGMNKSWDRLRDRAFALHGVRPLEFHCFRHTYISWALDAHVNMGWLSRQVGDDEETIYGHYKHLVRGSSSDHSFLNGLETAGRRPLAAVRGASAGE